MRQNISLNAKFMFYGVNHVPARTVGPIPSGVPKTEEPAQLMFAEDCAEYFDGCTFVASEGKILDPKGQLLNQIQFNGKYGGPRFVINPSGQPTNEPWTAATRSVFWRIPTVDGMTWNPTTEYGDISMTKQGLNQINTYRKPKIRRLQGDPSPFIELFSRMIPKESDRKILLDFIAHIVKYPGHKVRWAPVLQSEVKGAGKRTIAKIITYCIGGTELAFIMDAKEFGREGGAKFNGWLQGKLFVYVDEPNAANRFNFEESIRTMITEDEMRFENKGKDAITGQNYANLFITTNSKKAVPITKGERRYAPFFMPFESEIDLYNAGLTNEFFSQFNAWLDQDGYAIIYDWLLNYSVAKGSLPNRAPITSSYEQALKESLNDACTFISEAIEDGLHGFTDGWLRADIVTNLLREKGYSRLSERHISEQITKMIPAYHKITGKNRAMVDGARQTIYSTNPNATVDDYRAYLMQSSTTNVIPIIPGQMPPR